ncbi:MAG: tRNA-intron lyase, partial [Sulfolobales archaeon]|nr:tRNA-intron lyase [Sulfolobales archaeon]
SGSSHHLNKLKNCGQVFGYLIGSKVVVFDVEKARCLFSHGFYGKPVGVRKPREVDIELPLELSLIEALFLCREGVLKVFSGSREVGVEELQSIVRRAFNNFEELYVVYEDMKSQGFTVRSALKYGADFAIYRTRPGLEHAPYLVKVVSKNQLLDPGDIVGWGRISHSVRKTLLIAVPDKNEVSYVVLKWFKP